MKKIAGKIAMILVLVMFAISLNSCGTTSALDRAIGGSDSGWLVGRIIDGIGDAIDAVEESKYKRAAETVIQYDDVDSF